MDAVQVIWQGLAAVIGGIVGSSMVWTWARWSLDRRIVEVAGQVIERVLERHEAQDSKIDGLTRQLLDERLKSMDDRLGRIERALERERNDD